MRGARRAHLLARAWQLVGMFIDDQLVFNPATGRCDFAFDGTGLAIDTTPATAMLVAVGCDRRAHVDDALPDIITDDYAPFRLNARRGWAGDALDHFGRLIGSRLWVFRRRKHDEATRRGVESALGEAAAPFAALGLPVTIVVRWMRRELLGWQMQVGSVKLSNTLAVGG